MATTMSVVLAPALIRKVCSLFGSARHSSWKVLVSILDNRHRSPIRCSESRLSSADHNSKSSLSNIHHLHPDAVRLFIFCSWLSTGPVVASGLGTYDPSLKTRPRRAGNSMLPAARFGPSVRQTLGVLS